MTRSTSTGRPASSCRRNGDIWITDGHGGPQIGPNERQHVRLARRQQPPGALLEGRQVHQGVGRRHRLRGQPAAAVQRSARHRDRRRRTASTSPTAATSAFKCSTRKATSSPAGRSSASRAPSRSTTRATSTSRTACRTITGTRAGSAASASATSRPAGSRRSFPTRNLTQGAGTEFLGVDEKGRIFSGASGRPGLVVHELFRPLF